MTAADFDVTILGGGPTGLVFGLLLAAQTATRDAPLRILIVEAGPAPAPPSPEPALRVVALSPASRTLLEACGAWCDLPAGRIGPYRRMVVWQQEGAPGGRASITFDAAAEGVADLGYIVESDLARGALWGRAAASGAIELVTGVTPAGLELQRDAACLTLAGGRCVRSRLVVGADGQDSWLRKAAGIAARERPYGEQALVAHVASERPHAHTAWQRFLGDGPLALLPLADGRSSVVWSCPAERARALAAAPEADFNRQLTAASAGALGELRLTTARATFALTAGHAQRYTGLRFALIGDAAHRVHPLAGQGVNLGLQDAAALAETLADHLAFPAADPGDPLALRRFERRRKLAGLAMLAAMDALHGLFTSRHALVTRAAGHGLAVVDRLSPLKSRLADYALGRSGDLPRVLRAARLG